MIYQTNWVIVNIFFDIIIFRIIIKGTNKNSDISNDDANFLNEMEELSSFDVQLEVIKYINFSNFHDEQFSAIKYF